MTTKGTLYLIPCPISDETAPWEVLPAANRAVMDSLDYFIVENTRSARRFLAKAGIARPIDGLEFRELNEHTVAGREVELLRKEYDILHYFMSRPNHTIDKAALAEGVWGDHIDQADNFDFVYAQMKNLRRKLEKAGADIEIRAVYGFGYKLVRP